MLIMNSDVFCSAEFKGLGELSLKLLKKPKTKEMGFIIGKFANKIGSSQGEVSVVACNKEKLRN
jgi:hypothetical protein